MKTKRVSGVLQYLIDTGAINGTPAEIASAKRTHWNQVKREAKKRKKEREHSFTVSYTAEEHSVIKHGAQYHQVSITRFIKEASLAFIMAISISKSKQ